MPSNCPSSSSAHMQRGIAVCWALLAPIRDVTTDSAGWLAVKGNYTDFDALINLRPGNLASERGSIAKQVPQ